MIYLLKRAPEELNIHQLTFFCCHMLLRLLAQRDFSHSELVVSIPRSLCLTAEAKSPQRQQRPEERMAAALLREKSLGQKSQFRAPWYGIIQRTK